MKLLVTGASGFIGRELLPVLIAAGHELTVLLRDPQRIAAQPWSEGLRCLQGDLHDQEAVARACAGQEGIIHLAALAHVTQTTEEQHWQAGYEVTDKLLQAAIAAKVGHFLFMSSIKASPAPDASAYARAKAAAEDRIQALAGQAGMQWLILRPAVVYGPGMRGNLMAWMRRCQQGRVPALPRRCASLQMISVHELCRIVQEMLLRPGVWGQTYLLADPLRYDLKKMEAAIQASLGRPGPRWPLPRGCWWLAGQLGDALFRLFNINLGFSMRSYQTLFIDEAPVEGVSSLPSGIAPPRSDFYTVLPEIIAGMTQSGR